MEAIFHEKQEGSLCAQHCLNALLQGSYFTPVELATLAQQMDDEERLRMAESGLDSEEYRRFLEQPSGNYDDSGYFSVQVISSALKVWGLELIPYNSTEPRALEAQQCPEAMQAYICNYRDHWFTIRRLGHQWFNLNSLLTGPELISNTHLAILLAQLQTEGYSIFVVFGSFPESEADTLLKIAPAVQTIKPRPLVVTPTTASKAVQVGGNNEIIAVDDSDEELQRALRLSLGPESCESDPDEALQKALQLSLEANEQAKPSLATTNGKESDEALKKALRESLHNDSADEDELELERALKMSLECCDSSISCSHESIASTNTNSSATNKDQPCTPKITQQVNSEEIRQRRLAYLDGNRRQNGTPEASGKTEEQLKKKRKN